MGNAVGEGRERERVGPQMRIPVIVIGHSSRR
jgi:hypothetical protein